jgi:hypothetical protein
MNSRHLSLGELAKRDDNGRVVRVIEVRPVGLSVFYVTEDVQDGHTCILGHRDLRPVEREERR